MAALLSSIDGVAACDPACLPRHAKARGVTKRRGRRPVGPAVAAVELREASFEELQPGLGDSVHRQCLTPAPRPRRTIALRLIASV